MGCKLRRNVENACYRRRLRDANLQYNDWSKLAEGTSDFGSQYALSENSQQTNPVTHRTTTALSNFPDIGSMN